ncbi:MAG: hypothetical protein M0Q94_14555 [Candidatus Cloacimonetes bacterium]|nr:hypothetical protein [Candidatus Cloacimonadota bacterium]
MNNIKYYLVSLQYLGILLVDIVMFKMFTVQAKMLAQQHYSTAFSLFSYLEQIVSDLTIENKI